MGNFEVNIKDKDIKSMELDTDILIEQDEPEDIPESIPTGVVLENISPSQETRHQKHAKWEPLESIEIKNFKAIESITVKLSKVTILVGPNGGGKSSVLQAIHWAARAASYIPLRRTNEVISFDRLDYLPSSDPLKTAHKSELSSRRTSDPTLVAFNRRSISEGPPLVATVKIWAANNRAGISANIEGNAAVTPFKQRDEFITAYIPGLAGLAENETILVKPILRRQAASGDAGGVLRNVIFNLASRQPGESDDALARERLNQLNGLVQSVHPKVALMVSFDEREDANIRASFTDEYLGNDARSLEAAATGVLQVVQIFAYLILFRPKILLIDEPDAHLHPDKQERLIEALEVAAEEFGAQIILTTHSPHIARASSPQATLVWIAKGKEQSDDGEAIRRRLGWGGLDKKCILFVEDEDDQFIRAIVKQWPDIYRKISICRCFGFDNLPKNKLLEGLKGDGEMSTNILIHRDRDFMTDGEVEKWQNAYKSSGVHTWCTKYVDVEAYYCRPDYLAALYEVDEATAITWVNNALENIGNKKRFETFQEKRKVMHRFYGDEGGSPVVKTLWDDLNKEPINAVLGKKLHAALKPVLKAAGKDDGKLHKLVIPKGFVLAPDLKEALELAFAPSKNLAQQQDQH